MYSRGLCVWDQLLFLIVFSSRWRGEVGEGKLVNFELFWTKRSLERCLNAFTFFFNQNLGLTNLSTEKIKI